MAKIDLTIHPERLENSVKRAEKEILSFRHLHKCVILRTDPGER